MEPKYDGKGTKPENTNVISKLSVPIQELATFTQATIVLKIHYQYFSR